MRQIFFNNANAVPAASAAIVSPSQVAEGRIAAFDADNFQAGTLNLGALTSAKRIVFVQGVAAGQQPLQSGVIEVAKVRQSATKAYFAGAKQVTEIGFNGTNALTIPAVEDTSYNVKLIDVTRGFEPHPRRNYDFRNGKNDVPYIVASAIALAGNSDTSPYAVGRFEVISDITTAQLVDTGPASVTLSVTQGSKIVTAAVTNTEAIYGLVEGGFIRIGHATTKTFPIYKVASIGAASGTTQQIVLESAYQGPTATGVAVGFQNTAPDKDDEAGLRITAKEVGTSFATALLNMDGLTPIATVTPKPAPGSGKSLAQLFKDNVGRVGEFYRAWLPTDVTLPVDESKNYDIFTVEFEGSVTRNISKGAVVNELLLAVEATASGINLATFFGK